MIETPLMKQYKEIKEKYKEEILFFRLGDFYEMFFEDAITASKVLDITLTSRNKEKGIDIPLAGIPYHSAQGYINKLINNGYKVAICEQVEDPKSTKGLVKREVVKIVTPGTHLDIDNIDSKSNNYLLSIHGDYKNTVLSYVDITTGEFKVRKIDINNLSTYVYKLDAKEILVSSDIYDKIKECLSPDIDLRMVVKVKESEKFLKEFFNVYTLEVFSLNDKLMIESVALIIDYLLEVQLRNDININKVEVENDTDYTYLNINTLRNLDVIKNQKDGKKYGSLLWILDDCKTSMGGRLLRNYINNPLMDKDKINKRLDDVSYLNTNFLLCEEIIEKLKNVSDIERLTSKIVFGNNNAKDLNMLKKSLINSLEIYDIWSDKFNDVDISKIKDVVLLIDKTILEDAPFTVREGNMIKPNYSQELDEYRLLLKDGTGFLMDLEIKEKERTGIKNLKIKYNKVFGYFIELNRNTDTVLPSDYIIKQTLANNVRYITEELKNYEYKILNAKNKIEDLEYSLFLEINNKVNENINEINRMAKKIAYIDVMCSFSKKSIENNYVRPSFEKEYGLDIEKGRHPIIEKLIKEDFIPNDIKIDEENRFIILTGPNMAGKSTYMKQIALISLMAQIGSFVPAKSAKMSIIDKILTRIGASDDILSGQSTFMVEMVEVSNIINNATDKSLIILDEVGRGTSTVDGLSIAIAISNYLYTSIKAKTIFATHYHELTELSETLENITNYTVEVYENNGKIIFTHNIVKGMAKKSYGIEVAKLAGLPRKILQDSKIILKNLEKKEKNIPLNLFNFDYKLEPELDIETENKIKTMNNISNILNEVDIYNTTPMNALTILEKIKNELK